MKTNPIGSESMERPKKLQLSQIQQNSTRKSLANDESGLFKSLSKEDLLSPDSNDIIKKWLSTESEPSKRVQFAHNIQAKDENSSELTTNEINSRHDINPNSDQSNYNHNHSIQEENNVRKQSLNDQNIHSTSATKAKLHRSAINRALSISTIASSTTTSHSSSILPSIKSNHAHPPSFDNAPSVISSSTVKYRLPNLSTLDFNANLSESDKQKFDDIREQAPDEFQELIPTLFKLGILLWPKDLFDQKEQLTTAEIKFCRTLISIMEKDEQETKRREHLQNLYGNVLPLDDVLHKQKLLRESLSLHGQISLLETYRDEIKNLLHKKIQYWTSIPRKSSQSSYNEETCSITRSTIYTTPSRSGSRSIRPILSRKYEPALSVDTFVSNESFSSILPDKIDYEWKTKLIVKIIEQGMDILDQVRKLPQSSLENQFDENEIKKRKIVLKYKRWEYLWSILYFEEK